MNLRPYLAAILAGLVFLSPQASAGTDLDANANDDYIRVNGSQTQSQQRPRGGGGSQTQSQQRPRGGGGSQSQSQQRPRGGGGSGSGSAPTGGGSADSGSEPVGKDCFFRPNLGSPEGPDSGAC